MTKKVNANSKIVRVEQIRSSAGRSADFCRTLAAIGLGKIGKKVELPLNLAVLGSLKKVTHIVKFDLK